MASLIISCFALLWLTYALILKVQLLPMCMLCTRHPVTLIGFVQTLLSNLSILCNTSINQQPIVLYPLSWNANSLQAFPCTIRNDNATLEVVTKLGDKMVWNSTAQPPGVSYILQYSAWALCPMHLLYFRKHPISCVHMHTVVLWQYM